MGIIFKYRKGFSFKVDAQVAGSYLEELKKENDGELTPSLVVEKASDATNPIHDCFEWDDSLAANLHRRQQARMLIGSIVVIKSEEYEGNETKLYYNVSVKKDENEENKYVDVKTATSDVFIEQNREKAMIYLKTFVSKFQIFDYLQEEVRMVEDILKRFED